MTSRPETMFDALLRRLTPEEALAVLNFGMSLLDLRPRQTPRQARAARLGLRVVTGRAPVKPQTGGPA